MLLKQSTSYFNLQLKPPPCPWNYSATILLASRLQAWIARNRPHRRKQVTIEAFTFCPASNTQWALTTRDFKKWGVAKAAVGLFFMKNGVLLWRNSSQCLSIVNFEFPMKKTKKKDDEEEKKTPGSRQVKNMHVLWQAHSIMYIWVLFNSNINFYPLWGKKSAG